MTSDHTHQTALIVDDSAGDRRSLGSLLAPMGFRVAEAEDGPAGIRLWKSCPATAIFMDLEMPVLDGPSVIRLIRASGDRVPIVLYTGASSTRKIAEAIKVGATDYLAKPCTEDSVRSALERIGLAPGKAAGGNSSRPSAGSPNALRSSQPGKTFPVGSESQG
jgi:CheY-like chemotaxis protein